MSPHPEPLQMKRRKRVIAFGDPLRHAIIVRVFGLEGELEKASRRASEGIDNAQAAICAQPRERRAAVTNQPN